MRRGWKNWPALEICSHKGHPAEFHPGPNQLLTQGFYFLSYNDFGQASHPESCRSYSMLRHFSVNTEHLALKNCSSISILEKVELVHADEVRASS